MSPRAGTFIECAIVLVRGLGTLDVAALGISLATLVLFLLLKKNWLHPCRLLL